MWCDLLVPQGVQKRSNIAFFPRNCVEAQFLDALEAKAMNTQGPEPGVSKEVQVLLVNIVPVDRMQVRDVFGKWQKEPNDPFCPAVSEVEF